jgi:GNAT superfamily N-acetyltransferase
LIRAAITSDIPRIVELGSRSLKDGPYASMLKDTPEHSAALALDVIRGANGKILLYENDNGKVAGLLGFIIFPHYFTQEPTATEVMWYVEPEERKEGGAIKLLWEAEKQAKEMGATRMGFTAPTAEVGKLYERFGYKQVEVTYMKELRCPS